MEKMCKEEKKCIKVEMEKTDRMKDGNKSAKCLFCDSFSVVLVTLTYFFSLGFTASWKRPFNITED